MIRSLKNNESGMVLIMVLMVIVIMMVYSIGIISRGSSQTKSVEEQVSSIKAEQLAIGIYAKTYTDLASGGALKGSYIDVLDNRTYQTTVIDQGSTGPDGTNTLTITTPYKN